MAAQHAESLRRLLTLLMEADEPDAILSSLQRIAERKAHGVTRGLIAPDAARRWMDLAEAIDKVQRELH